MSASPRRKVADRATARPCGEWGVGSRVAVGRFSEDTAGGVRKPACWSSTCRGLSSIGSRSAMSRLGTGLLGRVGDDLAVLGWVSLSVAVDGPSLRSSSSSSSYGPVINRLYRRVWSNVSLGRFLLCVGRFDGSYGDIGFAGLFRRRSLRRYENGTVGWAGSGDGRLSRSTIGWLGASGCGVGEGSTSSGRLLDASAAGRLLEASAAGRLLDATSEGRFPMSAGRERVLGPAVLVSGRGREGSTPSPPFARR